MEADLGFSIPQFLRKDATLPPTTPRTPLPWRAVNRSDLCGDASDRAADDHYWEILAGNGYHNASPKEITGFGLSGWIWPQDAQYIEHACNCFPIVLAALEELLEYFEGREDASYIRGRLVANEEMTRAIAIRAALAKARGESDEAPTVARKGGA